MWLTNEEGTVIAYANTMVGTGFAASGTKAMILPEALASEQPLSVRAHTCPPAATSTSQTRTWRGIYEDYTATCCTNSPPAGAEVTAHGMTMALRWQDQQVSVEATKYGRMNFVKGLASQQILKLSKATVWPATGNFTTVVSFPPMETTLTACSIVTEEDAAIQKNPICSELSLVDNIVSNIESTAASIAVVTTAYPGTITYGGSKDAPVASFGATGTDYCAVYAKDSTIAGSVIGFSAGLNTTVLSLPLLAGLDNVSLPLSDDIHILTCCGIQVKPTVAPPVQCGTGDLKSYAMYRGALIAEHKKALVAAAAAGGFGARSTGFATYCDGITPPGAWELNTTTKKNCTCNGVRPGEIYPTWDCVDMFSGQERVTIVSERNHIIMVTSAIVASCIFLIGVGVFWWSSRAAAAAAKPATGAYTGAPAAQPMESYT